VGRGVRDRRSCVRASAGWLARRHGGRASAAHAQVHDQGSDLIASCCPSTLDEEHAGKVLGWAHERRRQQLRDMACALMDGRDELARTRPERAFDVLKRWIGTSVVPGIAFELARARPQPRSPVVASNTCSGPLLSNVNRSRDGFNS
jgi:hypothetical protein